MFLMQDGVTLTKVEEDTVIYVDTTNILQANLIFTFCRQDTDE